MKNITNDTIENSQEGILIDKTNQKNLLVSFGGVNQGLGMPVFEFFKSLKELNCDKIFFRDFNQMWYQKGVDDEVNSIQKLLHFLENEIKKGNYKEICFIGNSMGGYAAILFGTLLNVDNIVSFAPQTFIDKRNRLLNFDFRWKSQMENIYTYKSKVIEYFDLKKLLLNNNDYNSEINIYYSSKHRLDNIHGKRMRGVKGIQLHASSKGGHNLVKELKESGELDKLLKKIFCK